MTKIAGPEEMGEFAARFAKRIAPHPHAATTLALSGDLGAGKTTFAQALARALGVEEEVTSPTFVIEKIYLLRDQKFARLVHADAYRLNNSSELKALGFEELLADPGNLIVIEWPERVADLIPKGAIRISFSGSGGTREILFA